MKNTKPVQIFSYLFKFAIGFLIISPILLGFSLSFMSPPEMASIPPHFIPHDPVTYTYQYATRTVPIFSFMLNSFIVCAIVIIGQMLTCSFAAYAFSFFNFKGRKIVFMLVLTTMMIPVDAIIIANYLTISQVRLNDTYPGLVAPYLTSAMGIFLMRQFFLTIPRELHEAAIVDGCKDLRFLLRIVMPISKPALASLGVYVFIQVYNQFLWPLLVTNTNRMRTVQVGMSILKEAEAVDYGVVLAGSVLILIPAILVFIIGQRYLVRGMTAGAVKG
ncbi:MAG: carbohydrate ABC transporter permease [Spirochaetaceae bacterium]|jgi:sn-glycerol 3-phosphate transport system permease protein|nr:carbohydrate ABC transporter permease [Spirochaetaceae bacterium]